MPLPCRSRDANPDVTPAIACETLTFLLERFPSVCPEPVLVKRNVFSLKNGIAKKGRVFRTAAAATSAASVGTCSTSKLIQTSTAVQKRYDSKRNAILTVVTSEAPARKQIATARARAVSFFCVADKTQAR
jgi:hypothetical protein